MSMSSTIAASSVDGFKGWLIKRGAVRKNWLRRYFVLASGRLEYYESPNDTQPKGVMALFGGACRFMASGGSFRENCMEIATKHRVLYVASDDSREIQEWHRQVTAACDALKAKQTPPDWLDGDECEICAREFTFTRRKHHCRKCGGLFCQQDSAHKIPLPEFGMNKAVRVCQACYTERFSAEGKQQQQQQQRTSETPPPLPPPASTDDAEDDAKHRNKRMVREYSEMDVTQYVNVFVEQSRSAEQKRNSSSQEKAPEPDEEAPVVRKRTEPDEIRSILSMIAGTLNGTEKVSAEEHASGSMEDKLSLLTKGTEVWKVPTSEFAVARLTLCFLRRNADTESWEFVWHSKKKKDGDNVLPLIKCKIVTGQDGDSAFKRRKVAKKFGALSTISFSIVSPQRTINLVCCDENDYALWMDVLKYICDMDIE